MAVHLAGSCGVSAALRAGTIAVYWNVPPVASVSSQRKPLRKQNEHHDRTAEKRTEQDRREEQVSEQAKHGLARHGCTSSRLADSNRMGPSFIPTIRTLLVQT